MGKGGRATNSTWRRVSRETPCPICGKDHACKVSADGAVAMCKRIEQGAFKESKGWYFHRLIETPLPDYIAQAHRNNGKAKPQAPKAYRTFDDAVKAEAKATGGVTAGQWAYYRADGTEFAHVVRFNLPDGNKQFRPIHQAKDGWRIGDPSGLWPPYRLNDLPATGTVWLTEGEKPADAVCKIGLAATTSAHGSGAAEKTDWTPLAGRDVALLPDNDEAGRKYARDVARLLVGLSPPARVKIVDLPGLPEKGDIVEYIESLDSKSDEDIRGGIEAMAAGVPNIDPSTIVGGPILICMADIETKPIEWLWDGHIPVGCISLLIGRPKEGKSLVSIDWAARVSTGTPWPDGEGCKQGSVIIISAEDDPSRVIRPRLEAAHADLRKVHLLSAVRHIDAEGKRHDVLFTLTDVAALETALKAHSDCRLLIVDPIGSFLGGDTDAHRDNEVRSVLAPVARLAEQYGVAVLVIAHKRKSGGTYADDLAIGSRAFTGLARANWHLTRDKDNKARRLLLPGGCNYVGEVDGWAFTIHGEPPAISWERDPVAMTADEALAQENGEGEGPGRPDDERCEAVDWLADELADLLEHPVADLRGRAHEAGYAWRTVQRAARELRVIVHRASFGGAYIWRLPRPGATPAGGDAMHATMHATSLKREDIGTHGTHDEFPGKSEDSACQNTLACHNSSLSTHGTHEGQDIGRIDAGSLSASVERESRQNRSCDGTRQALDFEEGNHRS